METFDLVTILGPTASGKTTLACQLAYELDGEVISGDSRQVYKGMDIGTGKDLSEYEIEGKRINRYLIDIHEAGYKYNIYEYQHDFHEAYAEVKHKSKLPVLCGGSGLYIESVLKGFNLVDVPENKELRKNLAKKSLAELTDLLATYKLMHNTTDVDTAQRAIRAIEIEEYKKTHETDKNEYSPLNSLIIGVDIDRELRRQKISYRLKARLDEGMLDEVRTLLNNGLTSEDLIYYGLEYKYITQYIVGQLTYKEMFSQLEIAIHQFAKRQMTWFRGMEKRGLQIHWIDALLPMDEKINYIKNQLKI